MRNEMSILSNLAILIRIAYQIRLYRFSVRNSGLDSAISLFRIKKETPEKQVRGDNVTRWGYAP